MVMITLIQLFLMSIIQVPISYHARAKRVSDFFINHRFIKKPFCEALQNIVKWFFRTQNASVLKNHMRALRARGHLI